MNLSTGYKIFILKNCRAIVRKYLLPDRIMNFTETDRLFLTVRELDRVRGRNFRLNVDTNENLGGSCGVTPSPTEVPT